MIAPVGLHVDDRGQGAPVVFLHSSGMSGEQWRRTADAIVKSGRRAIVPDLGGHGRSSPIDERTPFSFTDDVAVVDRLLTAIGAPVDLVGHSYGGFIALRVALLDPSRVRSLALYDPVAFGVLEGADDEEGERDLSRVSFGWGEARETRAGWLRGFVDYWGGEGSWDRLRESAREEFLRVGWVSHEGARTLVADKTRANAYRAITAPTLLMTGESSPAAARRVVARLAASMPNARVERFEGAGHMGPLTHGKRLGELLLAHLAVA